MRRRLVIAALTLAALPAHAEAPSINGHIKARSTVATFPEDSLFRELTGAEILDLASDLRLNLDWRSGRWKLEAAGQLFLLHGDSIEFTRSLPVEVEALAPRLPDDRRRYFDLSETLSDAGKTATVARFDRLAIGWTGDRAVVRFGRQALSWGNGLFYAPMDLVNPFDPATIDTEFKAGDDMLYTQYLFDNDSDVQAAIVGRRNPLTGERSRSQATAAVKYHGFAGETEFDLLIADHYEDPVLGLGLSKSIGGAVWRGDVVVTETDARTVTNVVTNLSYSWIAFERNMTGNIEYYYNGFGQSGDYDFTNDPDLFIRLARGDLFTIGRHYLATSVGIEVTPLWLFTPLMLANLGDPSGLVQLNVQGNLGDNAIFLGTVSLPLGGSGTEFGGIPSGLPDRFLSQGPGLFAQLAWYF